MHPNRHFRYHDQSFSNAMIDSVGFGMIFCETPEGPRVAHSPLLATDCGLVRFHLARGNAISCHLPGSRALLVVNGPDAYVSARWYSDPDQVPTWNYVAVEMEGTVRAMERDGLVSLLEALSERQEAQIKEGTPWTMDKLSDKHREGLLRSIIGFEMEVEHWRETAKLSQNKSAEVLDEVVAGLEKQGEHELAELMRNPPS